jgi:sulfatase maturation enzyme AslB (radical SAM superfamily)
VLRYKEIFLGGRCDNNCIYCPARHNSTALADFRQITASLTQKEGDNIFLYGGEPTLRKDLLDIIDVARGNGYRRIKLLTNGQELSDGQFLDQVMTAGCHLFEIKLWGPDPSLHDSMTRTSGSFLKTLNGLENLAGYPGDKFTCVRIPVCKENFADMENTVITALNFSVNRIILSFQDYQLRLESVLPHIRNAINISIFNRTWILVEGIPFCVLQGLEKHMGEIYHGWDNIYDRTFRQHNYCTGCIYNELCPGAEAGYLDRFGNKEFTPVAVNKYFPDIKALHE